MSEVADKLRQIDELIERATKATVAKRYGVASELLAQAKAIALTLPPLPNVPRTLQ